MSTSIFIEWLYSHCLNGSTHPFFSSLSPKTCCLPSFANSMYRLPTSSSICYTNSHGFRQSSLILSSLCCGRFNRCYITKLPVHCVDRKCYCDKSCNFREECANVKRGLRKLMALGERGESYNFGVMNEAEVMLSLVNEDIYEECFHVRRQINNVVKKRVVGKIENGGDNSKFWSKKKRVELFVSSSKKGDNMRAEGIKMEEEREAVLRRENFTNKDCRDDHGVNLAKKVTDKDSSSIQCGFRKESEKRLTDVLSIENTEFRKGIKAKQSELLTMQVSGYGKSSSSYMKYDNRNIKSTESSRVVEKKQTGDEVSRQSERGTKYRQLLEIPDTNSGDVRNCFGSISEKKLERSVKTQEDCSTDKVKQGCLTSDVDEEQIDLKTLSQYRSGDSESRENDLRRASKGYGLKGSSDEMWKLDESLLQEPSIEETSQRIFGSSSNTAATLEQSVPALPSRFDECEEAYRLEMEQQKIDVMFMKEALLEARKAAESSEVPVGAVLVHNGRIIARGCNQVEKLHDSTAHAEMICIREGSNVLQNWRLSETTLYVTLEPCPMCAGAILQARIDTVVWGAPNKLLGADGSWTRIFPNGDGRNGLELRDVPAAPVHPFHPEIIMRRGVLTSECADTMRQFFQLRRKKDKKPEPDSPPSCLSISLFSSMFLTSVHQFFSTMFCL